MGPSVTADGGREDGWIICDLGLPTSLVGTATEDVHPNIIEEQAANARLIAAAPEMAEALADAPIIGMGDSAESFRIRQDRWLRDVVRPILTKIGASQ